ncbi:MAG: hypothetical protein AB7Q23_07345 [Hyphomonadaceae bacterium]
MRLLILAAVLSLGVCAPPARAQPLPPSLRSAGVTQAEWDAIRAEVRRQAQRAQVSEAALAAAAAAASDNYARSGRFNAAALRARVIDTLASQAAQIADLQTRLDALSGDGESGAALFAQARTALNEGRLGDADRLLAQAAEGELAAIQRADAEVERRRLRAGETMATRAQVAALQADYLGAAQLYARAADTAPQSATLTRWEYRRQQGYATAQRGNVFLEPAYLGQAADIYERLALPLVSRERDRWQWVNTQEMLGNTLLVYAGSGAAGARQRALAAFDAALSELTPERDRDSWARIQVTRANLLTALGNEGMPGAWRQAEGAYEAVLTVWTAESFPSGHATAQANLAIVRRYLGSSGAEALRASVAAAEAALASVSRTGDPARWATRQAELGDALWRLGMSGDRAALSRAVAAFEAALAVRTRAADAALWARTQRDLARVWDALGVAGEPHGLERALAGYDAALTVFTRETNPNEWSFTLQDLAITLRHMDERGVAGALEREAATYEAMLGVWTRQAMPQGWASVQAKLGYALRLQGERGARGALERAAAAYEAAMSVWTREAEPVLWASASYQLAIVYRALGRARDARAAAQGALAQYEQRGDAQNAASARALLAQLPNE